MLDAPTSTTRLQLAYNSTRRAPWHSKLGRQRHIPTFLIPPQSIASGGGPISGIELLVERRYPLIYAQELADGTRIVRTVAEHEHYLDLFANSPTASQQDRLSTSRFQVSVKCRCRHISGHRVSLHCGVPVSIN